LEQFGHREIEHCLSTKPSQYPSKTRECEREEVREKMRLMREEEEE